MHPVDYLFEDIYRNYWGIASKRDGNEPSRRAKPTKLVRLFRTDRR